MDMNEAFNAATAYDIGAECHGWDEWNNIAVVLTDDCKGLIYLGVPDGDKHFVYPLPDTISRDFLTFLMGKGEYEDNNLRCGDFTMHRRRGVNPEVLIYQE